MRTPHLLPRDVAVYAMEEMLNPKPFGRANYSPKLYLARAQFCFMKRIRVHIRDKLPVITKSSLGSSGLDHPSGRRLEFVGV